jgi:hypothetical protein
MSRWTTRDQSRDLGKRKVGLNAPIHQKLQAAGMIDQEHLTDVVVNRAYMTKTKRTFPFSATWSSMLPLIEAGFKLDLAR